MGSRRRRRLLWFFAIAALAALAVIASAPLWFPWALQPLAKRFGAGYAHYERQGYQRFRLAGVTFTNSSGRFEAKQVQAFVPTVWLWRCFVGPQSAPFLEVDSWNWNAASNNARPPASSACQILQTSKGKIGALEKWLPGALLTNGTARLKGQTLQISRAVWADGKLSARVASPRFEKTFQLQVAIGSLVTPKLNVSLDSAALQFRSRFTIAANGQSVKIQGKAFWLTNQIELTATLPEHGFVPETATLRADSFEMPAGLLKLKHYRNLTGSFQADWETNHFTLNLSARSLPLSTNWPPIRIAARASGDTNSARIDLARVSTPWLNARLSRGTRIQFKPPYLTQPATLDVAADLANQPWFAAQGQLSGEALLRPGTARFPEITFTANGTGLSMSNITAKTLQLQGDVQWPETNSVTVDIEDLKLPHIKPLRVEASCQGSGMNLGQMELALNAGASSLQMRGAAQLSAPKKELDVTALELSRSNQMELQLQKPFEATFQRNEAGSSNLWMFTVQPVIVSGEASELKLAGAAVWPQTGTFQITATNVNIGLVRDFLKNLAPEAELKHLNLAGGWTNSPVAFHLDSLAVWTAKNGLAFDANAQANGGTNGISIQRLSISSTTQTVCQAEGMLPITLEPEGTNGFVHINPDGPLTLQASTQTNSILWREIADASGLSLVGPQLKANVGGTWSEPQGQMNLKARRIRFPQVKHELPALENVDLAAEVNHDEVQISRFHFLIAGQPVQLTAKMPFQTNFWSTLMSQRRLPDWRKATAHLKIENAELAPFAKLMPEMLSPQGVLQADARLQPGGVLKGELTVTGAATLPLATLGSVRDIQFAVDFTGQTAELTNFSASIGGETVTADGRMPLNFHELNSPGLPPFVIHLHGTNVPLVRKASLLLRADLALALTNPPSGPGIVAGTVTLRDSLFLASLQSLIPENTAAPAHHPPYFSVAARPWSGWRLDVRVNGDQFMRVQTPVFHGAVSAAMNLQGALGNPLALGEVKIASGVITFPFGNLDVKQGFVSLTSDNPYHPRLFITAQAEQFGYNIKLEITGTADHPIVQFSSTPPLTSEEILMMLATGQLPSGIGASTSTRQRAQGLAMFFGKNLLSEFGLGLGQNRLTVRSGQQISEEGRPTYEVDYKLLKRWTLVGEYDQFDQYDLNLKWNFYSK